MEDYLIIYNPASGSASKKKLEEVEEYLTQKKVRYKTLHTKKRGDALEWGKEAAQNNIKAVVAIGGDGTINEVVNGIAGSETGLVIVPTGTANVLAKELGLSKEIPQLLEKSLQETSRKISLGKLTINDHETYFTMMVGVGFDAEAVHELSLDFKNTFGKIAYFISAAKTHVTGVLKETKVIVDDIEYRCSFLVASNIKRYGGNFIVTPQAHIEDGELDFLMVTTRNKLKFFKALIYILLKRHLRLKEVIYLKGNFVEILNKNHVQLDGDYTGKGVSSIKSIKNTLKVY
ncbi:MAG: diacylglycerol kinase family lipid kinase [Nitrospinae bacterium]|nr:diacylglycerol kinase family lipid kinase [Nitrospinota bacterium]